MAEKLTSSPPARFSKEDLERVVRDINRHKENASEHSGLAGKATQNACELYNFDKTALGFITRLKRKDPAQSQATLCAVIFYAETLGLLDQVDMFNDAVAAMEEVILRARQGHNGPESPAAKALGELVN